MRYVGYIHRLYIMLNEKGFTKNEIIDKIYDIIQNNSEIVDKLTKKEIGLVIDSRIRQ